jgi:hypothetical protein
MTQPYERITTPELWVEHNAWHAWLASAQADAHARGWVGWPLVVSLSVERARLALHAVDVELVRRGQLPSPTIPDPGADDT